MHYASHTSQQGRASQILRYPLCQVPNVSVHTVTPCRKLIDIYSPAALCRTKESFFGEMDRMRQLRESKLVIVSDFDRTITSYRGKDGND